MKLDTFLVWLLLIVLFVLVIFHSRQSISLTMSARGTEGDISKIFPYHDPAGGFQFRKTIGGLNIGGVDYPIILTHMFRLGVDGRQVSDWVISGTESCLLHLNGNDFKWFGLAGNSEVLTICESTGQTRRPRLLRFSNTRLVVEDRDGTIYEYDKEKLVKMKTGKGVNLEFETQGALLKKVFIVGGSRMEAISYGYTNEGRLKSIGSLIGGAYLRWDSGLLRSVTTEFATDFGGGIEFGYRDGILSKAVSRGATVSFQYSRQFEPKNPDIYPAVYMIDDGTSTYSIEATRLRTVQVKTEKATGISWRFDYLAPRQMLFMSKNGAPYILVVNDNTL